MGLMESNTLYNLVYDIKVVLRMSNTIKNINHTLINKNKMRNRNKLIHTLGSYFATITDNRV